MAARAQSLGICTWPRLDRTVPLRAKEVYCVVYGVWEDGEGVLSCLEVMRELFERPRKLSAVSNMGKKLR